MIHFYPREVCTSHSLGQILGCKFDRVKVLRYRKYYLLFWPVDGIEPVTSRWFHSEALSSQTPNPLRHVFLPVRVNRIRNFYPTGSNKGFSSRFFVVSRVQHEKPEEGRRTYRPERCDYNNKDEINGPNNQSYNNYQVSAQEFTRIKLLWF